MTRNQMGIQVLRLLERYHVGAENAITSREIGRIFNLSARKVRSIISDLRTLGQPIGSSNDGYFYAETVDEVEQTISDLLGRIKKVINATDGLVTSQKLFREDEIS